MRNSRVAITGGCGFIGRELTNRALEAGNQVLVVDDLSIGAAEDLSGVRSQVELAKVDLRDRDGVVKALADFRPEIVVHLAALHYIPACDADPKRCVDINVGSTQSVLDGCGAASVDGFVLASTAAVYAPQDDAHTERSPLGPTDIYGLTKLWAEQLAELFHRRTGTPVGIARLFNVFGPGETNPHLIPTILSQAREHAALRLGNVSTKRDYVYVKDVAEALLAFPDAIRSQRWLVANIGREKEVDAAEIVRLVSELVGRKLAITTEAGRMRSSDRPHLLSDSSLARQLLGWRARTDLRSGLRAALERPVAGRLAGS